MSGNGLSNRVLEKHLAKLEKRKALYAAAHPELGPMELRRSYWELACRRQGISESRRRRISVRKEIEAFIRLVKESMKHPEFWE